MERTRKPSHPGEVLKGLYMDPLGLTITETALRLGISRKTLSAIVNGRAAVSADMALRLSRAFNTRPEIWLNLQEAVDIWDAMHKTTAWKDVQPFSTQTV